MGSQLPDQYAERLGLVNLRAGGILVLSFLAFGAFNAITGVLQGPGSGSSNLQESVSHEAPEITDPGRWTAPCLGSEQLDGWINEARAIMAEHGIPGTYYNICRNIFRESGGDPNAINDWDVNAQAGTPSIGLLQVIKPTFDAHWKPEFGVPHDQYDPVANIVVACQYAWTRYPSIDGMNGIYGAY